MANSRSTVLIMAGGTGGHVFPALAVARELREQGVRVEWLGTRRGIEAELVPQAQIPIHYIKVAGLRGKGKLSLLLAPFRLLLALFQAIQVLRRVRPCAVLGLGGFASGPGGLAAWLLRRPLLIHEQNAIPGLTNRLLSRLANPVMAAFPGAFASRGPVEVCGNPVRVEIADLPAPEARYSGRQGPLRLLVVGGSLGAVAINQQVPLALQHLQGRLDIEVWHQTGKKNLQQTEAFYREAGVEGRVVAFIEDMAEALSWADLVLCRSGALTVSELSAAGVASVLVPFPHAVDDHQTANARYLTGKDAAVLLPQPELSADALAELLCKLNDRARLCQMATAARSGALPDAAARVAQRCMEKCR